ncbi:MAG TPA: prepilin-type N-terminal cleavage/methylation domain-containing protein [Candidatus Acidoferrales bacterium]
MRNREKGFSLIELLIVVAIILIIAAIAIPNLLQSRQRANETSAVGSLRTTNTSEVTFQTTYGIGYAWSLAILGPGGGLPYTCQNAGLLDDVLGCAGTPCIKSGYNFATANPPGGAPTAAGTGVPPGGCPVWGVSTYAYTATAVPNQGKRGYITDDSGVTRFCVAADPATPCTAVFTDAAVQ